MARKLWIDLPGLPQQVAQRGNDRLACFFCPDDYDVYWSVVDGSAQPSDIIAIARQGPDYTGHTGIIGR
ncbi:hypothetical protein CAI21_07830 [Alkalilimnicola ehrlichii]|uniref:Uncharacterized protein n=1 Tax=Alkalilimnicola ehrlichii TaxID=351052 RepID=A0A3E0WZJ5_9GAMM|nr:hypothetical protein [Alkalilimnicola ehrlichii]RFA30101.1 hypothetical protein CAI21_07830 [Alkalilimnicola ehrlichii]RFA37446.1 hypothetical protein CAL65_09170 [Alkalilimnicola ehrlichii]